MNDHVVGWIVLGVVGACALGVAWTLWQLHRSNREYRAYLARERHRLYLEGERERLERDRYAEGR